MVSDRLKTIKIAITSLRKLPISGAIMFSVGISIVSEL